MIVQFQTKKNKIEAGFTLVETLIVTVIAGILSAIAIVNLQGQLRDQRVNQAAEQIQGNLEEARQIAGQRSRTCPVTIEEDRISTTVGVCLVSGDQEIPDDIRILTNLEHPDLATATVEFNFRGTSTARHNGSQPDAIIVVTRRSDDFGLARCIRVPTSIAPIEIGLYQGSLTNLDNSQCNININP